jgi:putative nucleotidyltransferase with HDIG domain
MRAKVLLVTEDEKMATLFQEAEPSVQVVADLPPVDQVASGAWMVIAVTSSLTNDDALAWLSACRTRCPFVGRLLVLQEPDLFLMQQAINVAQVTQVLVQPTDAQQVRKALEATQKAARQQWEATLFPALLHLADWMDAQKPIRQGHTYRVLHYAWALGHQLHLPDDQLTWLRWACLLHDLGKLATWREEERDKHPRWSAWLAEKMGFPEPVREAVRHHHERWDGMGFPEQLAGERIPFLARLIAVADAYDWMLVGEKLPLTKIRERLKEEAGHRFDAHCVQALLTLQEPQEVLAVLERCDDLPALAPVVQQALELLMQEDFDWQEVADILSCDEELTAHLLRLANSAITGFRRRVTNLLTALRILGARPVINLLLTLSVRPLLRASAEYDLWRHSLGCALLARAIAQRTNRWDAEEAFTAALLHDLGKSLLWQHFPDASRRALEIARRQGCPLFVAERLVFGVTHAEVGGWLLHRWRLPAPLPDAVALHHTPSACSSPLAWCVYWADALWNRWAEGRTEGTETMSPFFWQDFPLDGPALVAEALKGVQEIEGSLGM